MNKIKYKIKKILPECILQLYRCIFKRQQKRILFNVFGTDYDKNCLLLYVADPFINLNRHTHQNQWQSYTIAKIISDFYYNVDVADFDYDKVILKKYDLLFNISVTDEHDYAYLLKEDAIKIAYLTGSDTSFSNREEAARLSELKKRRGVVLKPQRKALPLSFKMELYDAFFFVGNAYNLKTYARFRLPPVYFIPNTGYEYSFDGSRRDKKSFLFMGSLGQVHKGLDLLLEVFADLDDSYQLYICSGYENELDFCKEYKKELFHTSNIHAIGFVDVLGEKFRHICETCSYIILPSCSEGMAGTIAIGMSAGLIPIVSKNCGYDKEYVCLLEDCEIDTIKQAIMHYGNQSDLWIQRQSKKAYNDANMFFSQKQFSSVIKESLNAVIKSHGNF